MEFYLSNEPISAEQALKWGLVNRVVPFNLMDEVQKTAAELAQGPVTRMARPSKPSTKPSTPISRRSSPPRRICRRTWGDQGTPAKCRSVFREEEIEVLGFACDGSWKMPTKSKLLYLLLIRTLLLQACTMYQVQPTPQPAQTPPPPTPTQPSPTPTELPFEPIHLGMVWPADETKLVGVEVGSNGIIYAMDEEWGASRLGRIAQ